MRDAGGVLEVSLERAEVEARSGSAPAGPAAGSFVRLTVRDTGSGMDAVVRQRIFEPYFTTKPVGEGSGLGLAVVHGIVTGLGGVIAVESEPGRGTTFEVLLPRLEGGDEPAVAAEVPLPGGNERVLVVDDEDAVVDASRRMLEALGYRVTATTDSEDALARFRAEPSAFDLVLTDHTMPRLTGLELTRQLLAIRPALPVVLCTGYSDRVDEGKAKDAGARGLLLKPLGLRLLAEATRQALDEAAHRPV
jgi:CheY-like chemotaxis protein